LKIEHDYLKKDGSAVENKSIKLKRVITKCFKGLNMLNSKNIEHQKLRSLGKKKITKTFSKDCNNFSMCPPITKR